MNLREYAKQFEQGRQQTQHEPAIHVNWLDTAAAQIEAQNNAQLVHELRRSVIDTIEEGTSAGRLLYDMVCLLFGEDSEQVEAVLSRSIKEKAAMQARAMNEMEQSITRNANKLQRMIDKQREEVRQLQKEQQQFIEMAKYGLDMCLTGE